MKTEWERLEPIRIRIMSEAYDLADRGDSEGYNSVKVMCSDVLALIETALAHPEQRHVIDCPRCGHCCPERQAPEGWVKIDEVRKYFDSVGCGTIYKTAGEDRVPLYLAKEKNT